MASRFIALLSSFGRDPVASFYTHLRPIVIGFGFALAFLFLVTSPKDSEVLVSIQGGWGSSGVATCKAWFEEQDAANAHLLTGRDFDTDPVNIYEVGLPEWFKATKEDLAPCDIKCRPIPYNAPEAASVAHWDATTDEWPRASITEKPHGYQVIRNVEPPIDFPGLAIDTAHATGYDIVMTSELASDVPIPYVGISISDYFASGVPFAHKKPAAMAVISNCAAKSFRLTALEMLRELGVPVDSYGYCNHTMDWPDADQPINIPPGKEFRYVQKIAVARTYMFYLSFENSQWPDYVTEKFFQALEAGAIPVVIGAPNIAEFAPAPGSYLELGSVADIPAVAERMKVLMENESAYEELLAWRQHEATDSFKEINDIRGVHATCRLCIHIATKLQAEEAKAGLDQPVIGVNASIRANHDVDRSRVLRTRIFNSPCVCQPSDVRPLASPFGFRNRFAGASNVYRLYVRERGRFRYRSVFLDGTDISLKALHVAVFQAFAETGYEPSWVKSRKEMGIKWASWKVYRVHPSGITIRAAMGNGSFTADSQLQRFLQEHPCPKLEAVLV